MTKFTSTKLNWLTAIAFDRRCTDYALRVAYVISNHLNAETGRWMLATDTIAFETGSMSIRKVGRATRLLRDLGYLKVHRTGGANVYEADFRNVKTALAVIGRARFEKRQKYLQSKNKRDRIGQQCPNDPDQPDQTKMTDQIGHRCPTYILSLSIEESLARSDSQNSKKAGAPDPPIADGDLRGTR
jgi:hypothetical protein